MFVVFQSFYLKEIFYGVRFKKRKMLVKIDTHANNLQNNLMIMQKQKIKFSENSFIYQM